MTKPWHRRARHAVGHSLKVRLVLVFLLLAGAMAFTFISGVQKALSVGWRDGARPMLMDYVDRLAADITADKSGPPRIERAKAIAQRLPVGTQLRILPNHACATGAQFPDYHAVTGDQVEATWARFYGW